MRRFVLLIACLTAVGLVVRAQEAGDQPPAVAVKCDPRFAAVEVNPNDPDPFAGRKRVMKACVAEWQAKDAAFEKALPEIGWCGAQFAVTMKELEAGLERAMAAKANYYDGWKGSVESEAKDNERFMALQKARKAEIESELGQADTELNDLNTKKTALKEADPEKLKQAIEHLDGLVAIATSTRDNLKDSLASVIASQGDSQEEQSNQKKLLASLIAQQGNVRSEKILWESYYGARKARARLVCGRQGPEMEGSTRPGQKKQ